MPRTVTKKVTEKTKAAKPAKTYAVPATLNQPRLTTKKVAEKTQTDGKDWESPKARPRTLEELWGFRGSKYTTTDADEYKAQLSRMNKADLQQACIKVGLMPHDSRQIMAERLIKQFRVHTAGRAGIQTAPKTIPKATEASEKLRRWMETAGGNTLR